MSNSPDIEQIIRLVLERLAVTGHGATGQGAAAGEDPNISELVISQPVVTLSLVERQLDGKRRVRIRPRAVVTPAVRDLLRSHQIELVRDVHSQGSLSPSLVHSGATKLRIAPVFVCGQATWFASLPKHLCPKQAVVQACEETQASSLIADHLRAGGSRAVWISVAPFAASVASAKAGLSDAVLLPSLRETNEALSQANPQTVIVDASRWTVAAIGNLVRTLVRSR